MVLEVALLHGPIALGGKLCSMEAGVKKLQKVRALEEGGRGRKKTHLDTRQNSG